MAEPIHIIKPSFSGGEFAPSLWARTDIQKYATGARTLRNFYVHPHGGISNRPGTHMVAPALFNNKKIRVAPFEFASDESYVIEFGDYYCRFFNNNQLTTASTVTTPYTETDLPLLRFAQSADVLFIVHPDYSPRMLERTNSTTFVLADYEFLNGPFQLANDDTTKTMHVLSTTGNTTLVSSAAFFDAAMIGGQLQITHEIEGQAVSQAFTSSTVSASIHCGGTWRIVSHGTWAGKFRVEKSTDGGSTWTNLRQFSGASDFNVETYGNESMANAALPFLVRVNMNVYTSGTCNVDLDTDPYTHIGVADLKTYISPTQVSVSMQRATGSTAVTSNWAEGAWSDYRGWPQTVTFAQDRLIFACNYNQPQTIWMTETGNYYDFWVNSPVTDADGISLNLPSQKLNQINGLVSLLKLLVFSTGAEWTVGGDSTNSVIAPTTMNVTMNSMTGSSGIPPIVIVNRAIYVQSRGCVVRDLGYDIFTNTFTGANLSILANHLFFNYNIVEMTFQQDPDCLVWAVRDDGKMLCMTYMREQEILAWTWHDTYNGVDAFESVCSIPATGYNQVWFSVNRGGQRYIERMDQRRQTNLRKDQFFVDSGVTKDSTSTDAYAKLLMHFDAEPITDDYLNVVTNPAGEVDFMEYASDAAAQSAYVTSDVGTTTMSVAYDSGELAAPATSITISGLNGNVDEEYELIARIVYGGTSGLGLRFNADATSNIYGTQTLNGKDTNKTATRATANALDLQPVDGGTVDKITFITGKIRAKSGQVRTAILKFASLISTTTVTSVSTCGYSWNNSVDNLISMALVASANGLGIGSRVILLKKSSTPTTKTWEEIYSYTVPLDPADSGVYTSTICTGGTPTASASWAPSTPAMCFDGRWAATDATWRGNSNFWNGQTSGQLVYDLGAGVTKTARRYKIQCGYGVGSYNPTAWTFEGSNTGAFAGEQTTLDTQTGISWTDKEIKTFSFANSTAYRYYRFNYSAVDGASSCIIYEMEIYEMVPKGATSLTIPSLTGNSDVLYRLRARVVNGYNGTSIVGVRPNGDTAGNYGYQNLRGISTGVDASGGAVIDLVDFCVCTALNNISSAEMILYAKSGYVRTAIHETVLDVNGTGVLGISLYGHSYTDTATEITTLVIYASQANGLGIGSSFSLERLNL